MKDVHLDLLSRASLQGAQQLNVVELAALAFSRGAGDLELNKERIVAFVKGGAGIARLKTLNAKAMFDLFGLEDFESKKVVAAMELGRRLEAYHENPTNPVDSPEAVLDYIKLPLDQTQESFFVLCLNAKNNVLETRELHKGTLTSSIVGVREVFKTALDCNAASIIVAHNHPSGDPEPSPEDIDVTRKLVEAGELLEIVVHDHIIVAGKKFVSLNRRGLM